MTRINQLFMVVLVAAVLLLEATDSTDPLVTPPSQHRVLQITLTPSTVSPGSTTNLPSAQITGLATRAPSQTPSATITGSATRAPSASPSNLITGLATRAPSASPTELSTAAPSIVSPVTATPAPSITITGLATRAPSTTPSDFTTQEPSATTTSLATRTPSISLTDFVTQAPSSAITGLATRAPSTSPTNLATLAPSAGSIGSVTLAPSAEATGLATRSPSSSPTNLITPVPSIGATGAITAAPSGVATSLETRSPTVSPTFLPTTIPTVVSTIGVATQVPSMGPTSLSTTNPTAVPAPSPLTIEPTTTTSSSNTNAPSIDPTVLGTVTTTAPTSGEQTPSPTTGQPTPLPSPTIPQFFVSESEDQASEDQDTWDNETPTSPPVFTIQRGASGPPIENTLDTLFVFPTANLTIDDTVATSHSPTSDPSTLSGSNPTFLDTFHPSIAPQLLPKSPAMKPKSLNPSEAPLLLSNHPIMQLIYDIDVSWTSPPIYSSLSQAPVQLTLRSQGHTPTDAGARVGQTLREESSPAPTIPLSDTPSVLPDIDNDVKARNGPNDDKKREKKRKSSKAHGKKSKEKLSSVGKQKKDGKKYHNSDECAIVKHGKRQKKLCRLSRRDSSQQSLVSYAPVVPVPTPAASPHSYAPTQHTSLPSWNSSSDESDAQNGSDETPTATVPPRQFPSLSPSIVLPIMEDIDNPSPVLTRHGGDESPPSLNYNVGQSANMEPFSATGAVWAPTSPSWYWAAPSPHDGSIAASASFRSSPFYSSSSGSTRSGYQQQQQQQEKDLPHEELLAGVGARIVSSEKVVGVENPQIALRKKRTPD